jgi:ribonuclease P protein component
MAAPAPHRLTLPRDARLRRPADFARVRRQGRRVVRSGFIVNWLARPPGARARVGVVTPRAVGSAVMRSRARRLLREVFRRHQHELAEPVDLVLVARQALARQDWAEVEREFLAVATGADLIKPAA